MRMRIIEAERLSATLGDKTVLILLYLSTEVVAKIFMQLIAKRDDFLLQLIYQKRLNENM